MSTATASGTQAVDRAARLLSTVVAADEPLAFADIAEECGLPKSTTSRLLTALERTELLERNDAGSYVAGPVFWRYATRHDPWEDLSRVALPVLQGIGQETGETVNLGVPRGDRVVHVAQVDARYLLGTRDWTQVEVPSHASALGKVLFAYGALPLPAGELTRLTDRTLATGRALAMHAELIRQQGYATTIDELELGLSGVATPVRDAAGEVIAALGVSGPTTRLHDRLEEIGHWLGGQADQLTSLLNGLLRRRTHKEGVA